MRIDRPASQRAVLRRDLLWMLIAKFTALALLWALFFRGGR